MKLPFTRRNWWRVLLAAPFIALALAGWGAFGILASLFDRLGWVACAFACPEEFEG